MYGRSGLGGRGASYFCADTSNAAASSSGTIRRSICSLFIVHPCGCGRSILDGMSSAGYVMGHNDRERRRLALQGAMLAPLTEQFLTRAGIGLGMRVLDLGCGVGDVTMIAARL